MAAEGLNKFSCGHEGAGHALITKITLHACGKTLSVDVANSRKVKAIQISVKVKRI